MPSLISCVCIEGDESDDADIEDDTDMCDSPIGGTEVNEAWTVDEDDDANDDKSGLDEDDADSEDDEKAVCDSGFCGLTSSLSQR